MATLNTRITDLEPVDISQKVDPRMAYDQRPNIELELEKSSNGVNVNITLEQLRKKILSDMYPVGTIYYSTYTDKNGDPMPPNLLGLPGNWKLYGQNVNNSTLGGAPAALFGYKQGDSRFTVSEEITERIRGNTPFSSNNVGYLDTNFSPDHWGAYVFKSDNMPQHTHATKDYNNKTTAVSEWGVYNSKGAIQKVEELSIDIKPSYGLLSEHKYVKDQIIAIRDLGETTTNIAAKIQDPSDPSGKKVLKGNPYATEIEITEDVYKKINNHTKAIKSGSKYIYKVDTGDLAFVKFNGKFYIFQEVREAKSKTDPAQGDETKNKWTEARCTSEHQYENKYGHIPVLGTHLGEVFKPATNNNNNINWKASKTTKGYPYYNPVATPMPMTNDKNHTPTVRVKDGDGYKDKTGFNVGDYVTYKETVDGVTTTTTYVYVNDPEVYSTTVTNAAGQKKKSSSGGSGGGGGSDKDKNLSNAVDPYGQYETPSAFVAALRSGKKLNPKTGKVETIYTYENPENVDLYLDITESSNWYNDDTCDTNVNITIEAEDVKYITGDEPSSSDIMSGKTIMRLVDGAKNVIDKVTKPKDGDGKKRKTSSSNGAGITSVKTKTVYRRQNVKIWIKFSEAYQCEYQGRTVTNVSGDSNSESKVTIKGNNKKFMPNNANTSKINANTGDVVAYGSPGSEYILKTDDRNYVTAIDNEDDTVLYTYNQKKNAVYWVKEDTGFSILDNCLDTMTTEDETRKDIISAEPFAIAEHSITRNYANGDMVAHNKKVYIADGSIPAGTWESQKNKWYLYDGTQYYAHDISESDKKKMGFSQLTYNRGGAQISENYKPTWKTGLVLQPVKSDEQGTGEPGDNRPVPFSTHMHPGYGMIMWPNNGFTSISKAMIEAICSTLTQTSSRSGSQNLDGGVPILRSYVKEAFTGRQPVVRGPSYDLYNGKTAKFNTNLYPPYPVEQDENNGWKYDQFEGWTRTIDTSAWSEWDNYNIKPKNSDLIEINGMTNVKHVNTAVNVLPPYVTACCWVRYS